MYNSIIIYLLYLRLLIGDKLYLLNLLTIEEK